MCCWVKSVDPSVRYLALSLWIATMACFFVLGDGSLIKWWFYPH